MNARELAAQFGLRRTGRSWRGACPACGYHDAFVLSDGKRGPVGWCASCSDRDGIARVIGDPSKATAPTPPHKAAILARARLERVERIWRNGELVMGTPAVSYLDARGIGHLATCPELRFHANCPHPTSERRVRLPALLAAARDSENRLVGIHRTFLRGDGSGKAEIEPQKASLGAVRGCAVRLASLEHVLEVGELVLGEGIETAASAGLLLSLPAWAAISAGNLARGVVLPTGIRKVVIASDSDPVGQDAARDAWFRFRREGRAVRVATPHNGRGDFNDIALAAERRQ
jgi:phage/plasmid primase-like uncharacterized protein